jgi:hypothetical protein
MDNANHGHVPGADLIRHAESDTEYSTPDARMQDKVGVDRRTAVVPRAAAGGNSPAVDHAHAGVFVVDPHLADGGFEVRPEQLAGVTRAVSAIQSEKRAATSSRGSAPAARAF